MGVFLWPLWNKWLTAFYLGSHNAFFFFSVQPVTNIFLWTSLFLSKKNKKYCYKINYRWSRSERRQALMVNFRRLRSGQVWQEQRHEQHGIEKKGGGACAKKATGFSEHNTLLPCSCKKTHTCMRTQADSLINRLSSLIALQVIICFLSWYADKWQGDQTVKSKKTTAI